MSGVDFKRWLVWGDDDGREDGEWYEALRASYAAEQWAYDYDQRNDWDVARHGADVTVHVEGEDGNVRRFTITGQWEPTYNAEPAPPPHKPCAATPTTPAPGGRNDDA